MKTRYEELCASQMERLNDKLQNAYKDSEDPVNQRIETLNSRFETISEFIKILSISVRNNGII